MADGVFLQRLLVDVLTSAASFDFQAFSRRSLNVVVETVTKRRNRLKGDIVEAIQVLKAGEKSGIFKSSAQPTYADELRRDDEELDEEAILESIVPEGSNSFNLDFLDDDCFED